MENVVDIARVRPSHDVLKLIPAKTARAIGALPLAAEAGKVVVCLADCTDFAAIERVEALFPGRAVEFAEANDPELFRRALRENYPDAAASGVLERPESLFAHVMRRALARNASDIHVSPTDAETLIRLRTDGRLQTDLSVPAAVAAEFVSYIKVLANLDIAEKRLPMDGRIGIRLGGEDIDIRVSTMPGAWGESISLRLLAKSGSFVKMADLGFNERDFRVVDKIIRRPNGIFLVTGPTGSGKSTSLYSFLHEVNTMDVRILTAEDPIEYQMDGIIQVQMNKDIGLDFARTLRAFLRQDPDKIMVGEIRDQETADIAIQAALTGHLVFSTLHTNDAAGAFTRLIDMGVEPFLVSSSLELAMAQRLVRRLCPLCKLPYEPSPEELAEIGITRQQIDRVGGLLYKPCGCKECNNSGYKGRTAIYEMMVINDAIRRYVMQRADAATIKREAESNGMTTLRADGIDKVLAGISSIPEILRVTQDTSD